MAPDLAFAGEVQDLQEVLGNLLDNAWKELGQTGGSGQRGLAGVRTRQPASGRDRR